MAKLFGYIPASQLPNNSIIYTQVSDGDCDSQIAEALASGTISSGTIPVVYAIEWPVGVLNSAGNPTTRTGTPTVYGSGQTTPDVATGQDEGSRAINQLRLASVVINGETVTIGTDIYEVSTVNSGTVTAGHVKIDLSPGSGVSAAVSAQGTLTSDNTNVANGATVTIGSKVYTFQTVLTNVDGNVFIGASADASLTNLASAINLTTGAGTTYAAATTANAALTTAGAVTAHAIVITATVAGVAGNSIASTETSAHLAFDAVTLGTTTAGVDPTVTQTATAIALAINNHASDYGAEKISANEVLIEKSTVGVDTRACTETLAGANNAWTSATMYGGLPAQTKRISVQKRVPLAQEVTLGTMHFVLPFVPTYVRAFARVTSSGLDKLWVGATIQSGNRVTLDNSGATDWAATDTVYVYAEG